MVLFDVDVVGVSATLLVPMWAVYDGDRDFDRIEQACAVAGIYCDWIARHIATIKDPDALLRWSCARVEVRSLPGKRLRARWEMRASGFLLVKP